MASDVRPFSALRSTGLLWLVNTSLLHPRGFALGLHYPNIDVGVNEPDGWLLDGEGREPWRFEVDCDEQFAAVQRLLAVPRA